MGNYDSKQMMDNAANEAARQADHVFATGHLLDLLGIQLIACSAFSDFYDLLHQVRLL